MRKIFFVFIFFAIFTCITPANAATLSDTLKGRILLQVESHGEAWYVNPANTERYYLGRKEDAYTLMRTISLGITNANLAKIPVAGSSAKGDLLLRNKLSGRILLQVEAHGEAWYVYPLDKKRYYLGTAEDAYTLMRTLGLGISDTNLLKITISKKSPALPDISTPSVIVETPKKEQSLPISSSESSLFSSFQTEALTRINEKRLASGAPAVSLQNKLNQAAQAHAEDMKLRGYFDIKSPGGKETKDRLSNFGYEGRAVGELIAIFPGTIGEVIESWASKAAAYEVITKKDYEHIGVGFVEAGASDYWVLTFASSQTEYEEKIKNSLQNLEEIRNQLFGLVNEERAKVGLPALAMHPLLHQSAQAHAEDMLAKGYFAHENLEGKKPHDRILATNYPARASAENIASGQTSVLEVHEGWMNSPGHKANILANFVTEVGFGIAVGDEPKGSFNVYWVQNFGKR